MHHLINNIFFALIFFLPAFSHAEEALPDNQEENVYSFDTVVVTASKSSQSSFDMPAMSTLIDMEKPSIKNASSISDVFRDEPFVQFTSSARRNGQTANIRGFDKDSVLVLIDGVRQNFQSAHDGVFFIDPSLLKRVEVLRGSNSALYGSGGMGGVISMETKDAMDFLQPGELYGATFGTGYQSANLEKTGTLSTYTTDKDGVFDMLGSYTYKDSGDIELGDDSKLPSDDEVQSGLAKLKYFANDANSLGLSFQEYNNNAIEPNNPSVGFAGPSGQDVNKDTTSYTTRLTHEFDDTENDIFKLKTQLYHIHTNVVEELIDTVDVSSQQGDVLGRKLDTFGVNLDAKTFIDKGESVSNTLSYGAEYYTDEQNGSDSRNGERGGVPDSENQYAGVYVQNEINIKPDWDYGEFMLTPAARYDTYESESATGLSNQEEALSPKFAITYNPVEWFMTFASYAEAFRAPNLTELYSTGTHFPGNVFTPNPYLKPESSITKEIGMGFDFDDTFYDKDNLNFKISNYFTDSENYINQVINAFTTDTVNVPKAKLHGAEAEFNYKNNRIDFGMGFITMTGRNVATSQFVGNLSPDTLTTRLGIKIPEYDSVIGWRVTGAKKQYKTTASGNLRDGYSVHDVYYEWQPEKMKSLNVNIGVDNIFDKTYETMFEGSLEPGRNYKVRANYSW